MLRDSLLPVCFLVLHEAVSTGDPEMVYTVLQHRDYHNTSMALEGVPELLHKILEVTRRPATLNSKQNNATISGVSCTALSLQNSEYGTSSCLKVRGLRQVMSLGPDAYLSQCHFKIQA